MKKLFFVIAAAIMAHAANAEDVKTAQAYITEPGVAVFIPEGFSPEAHLPSPIFLRELTPSAPLPASWDITPVFKKEGAKTIVEVNVGSADLYGTGEVWGPLRRNGDKNIFWNRDNGAYGAHQGKMLYQTHPWVLGWNKEGSAFGIIFDNTWRSELTSDNIIRYISDGPACRVIVIKDADPSRVLEKLGSLSGTMELPPLWSLGYQQCRFSYYPDTRVQEIADEFRQRQIPCDVIWMDIHYMDDYRIFTFHPDRFPDPKKTNDYLHKKGFKSVYMIDPGVKVDSEYFVDKQLVDGDYGVRRADGTLYEGNVWPGACHFPDFTRPDVRTWWAGLYKDYMALGVDGVWNDMNEPAVFGGGDEMTMPDDNVHLGGDGRTAGNHVRYHNIYGYNMVKASREGILAANPDRRPFVLSRSNFLGGQRYAATWTGDNFSNPEQMKGSIPMTLNMGLSGQMFNGPDIGGFLGNSNPELLAQWTSFGVYFPFVRNHSCDGTRDQEPWAMGAGTEQVCKTAINRRYRLLPYIYTTFHNATIHNQPIIRPVSWADMSDLTLRDEQHAFMLGGDILIIPRFANEARLPKGDWDLFTLEDTDDGFQAFTALRPGAAIPLANLYQNTTEYNTDSLTILVNPDAMGTAHGTLYEDAGDGFGYKHGDYALSDISCVTSGSKVTVTLTHREGQRTASNPRHLRVGIVADGHVTYSPWTIGNSVTMNVVKDKKQSLDKNALQFRPLPNDYNPGEAEDIRIGADQLVK